MNGIIVEINRKDAVLLTDDGLFLKIKNRDYAVGQSVSITKTISRASKLITVAASMAAVISICTIGGAAYFTPTDYVSLDVNPSIEYTVNRFDRILDVKAVNDDGTEILSELDLDNMELENAVKKTIDQLIADGYLTNDENGGVVITTSNKEIGKAEELAAELEEELQIYIDDKKEVIADVEAEAVGLDRVREARQLGVTPGKLNLVDKLRASTDSAIDEEQWLDMPVREINKAIKHNNEAAKDQMKERFEDIEENNPDNWTDQDDSLDKPWKQNDRIDNRESEFDDEDSLNSEDDLLDGFPKNDGWNNGQGNDSLSRETTGDGIELDDDKPFNGNQNNNGNHNNNDNKRDKQESQDDDSEDDNSEDDDSEDEND